MNVETESQIRAVLYARVSTDREEQAGSIPTQLARCRGYCSAMGWRVVEEYCDQGVSGTTLDRPGWNQVEQAITAGHANMVVATSLDRLARTDEFTAWLRRKLHPAGADFATLDERIDTSTASGRLALGILVQIAQYQAEQTREKTSAAMASRAERGLWVVRPPFGTKAGGSKGIPEKDPATWPWVEHIFRQAASGVPRAQILAQLKAQCVRGPNGGEFATSTLSALLANPFYKGCTRYRGKLYEAQHDCVIDAKLWEEAQREGGSKAGRRPVSAPYLFRGKVVTDQLTITEPPRLKGQMVPLVPCFSRGRNAIYPSYYRADRRRKYGGIKAELAGAGTTGWLPSSVPAHELDEAVIESLIGLASADQRGVLMLRAKDAAVRLEQQTREERALKAEALSKARRKKSDLVAHTVRGASKATMRLMEQWDKQLRELDLEEQTLLGQVQACDDILGRLEQAELETEATLDQVNLVSELWQAQDWGALRKLVELLVDKVIVRANEAQYEVRVRLYPIPVVRTILETIPNAREAVPPGIEPGSPA